MGFSTAEDAYTWYYENNTELTHTLPYNYYAYCYWGGGHAISHYVSGNYTTYGDYMSQLTVYQEGISDLQTVGGGNGGSDNFACPPCPLVMASLV